MKIKVKQISSIDTALRIYYRYSEIGNKEIKELFGNLGNTTLSRYKEAVKQAQAERGIMTSCLYTVNTELAYEVWGLNVADLERRRKKLISLGLPPKEGAVV